MGKPSSETPAKEGADLPKLDFSTFVLSVVNSALIHLGDAPHPDGDKGQIPNLIMARSDIDLLELLQEKTEGNLTGSEERLLAQALYDLRMRYVEVSKSR